ncbi:monooxygenase [Subtercola boreus]|uniref:Monooxygenase n=1 Tax=Subtercola boreus TaxID=120213 RepID=A0A3E0W1U8_9MICO|nr:FAD-dependent monooxygenase [Subtercola boreus]RFA15970.1 monooxygenase [Subtercola boreus]
MENPDVLVVGGGPVGLATAIGARRTGLRALVVEPRPGPIDKACGEGLMPGALAELDRLGVRPHGHPIAGISYHDGSHEAEHRFRGSPGLGVRRTELSRALHERAAESGVGVGAGRVVGVTQDARGVDAALADGSSIRCRWLVGCDGLHSGVRRLAGLEAAAPRGGAARRYGLRRHFRRAPWSDVVEVFWSGSAEIYVTPVDDELVGVAMLGPRGLVFADEIARIPLLAEFLRGAEPAGPLSGAGPLRQRVRAHASGRVLLVGDASGYLDALTGEGMRIGFAQAAAAVRAIAGTVDTPLAELSGWNAGVRAAASYEREWHRASGAANRFTAGLLLASQSPVRRMIVPTAERMPGLFSAAVEVIAR